MKTKIFILLALFASIKCTDTIINEPEITEKDNSSTVMYKANTKFNIALEGNITTGYSWNVASIDTTKINQIGTYEYKSNEGTLIGRPGKFIFKFKTVNKGESFIKFYYARTWETGIAPVDSFKIKVNIDK